MAYPTWTHTTAIKKPLDVLQQKFQAGLNLHRQGKLPEAAKLCEEIIFYDRKHFGAHLLLGVICGENRQFERAAELLSKAIKLNPGSAEAYFNRGIVLKELNRNEQALLSYDTAISLKHNYHEAYYNRGIVLLELSRFENALASNDRAIFLKPDFAEAYNNRGMALKELNRLDEALASCDKAIELKPNYAAAHKNRGFMLKELGRPVEALASYNKAIELKPDYAEVYSSVCELYETQNNTEEFERVLGNAVLNCGKDNPDIVFRLAQLANRKDQFDDAASQLRRVDLEKMRPALKPAYFNLLGKICDKLGQFEEAFSAFEKQNELTRATLKTKTSNAGRYLDAVLLRKASWAGNGKPAWPGPAAGSKQASPAFLVGFPRSGTTLLDTILRSHSAVSVVEEKPMVTAMCKALKRAPTIQNLDTLPEAGVIALRDVYFKELKMHLDEDHAGKLIVDKLPLNIAEVGTIHRAFPDAKFILALRHPCDCVLSCFMQNFKLNDAMANFLSLDQSARLYAAVMELWSTYRQKLNLNVHVLKYEDLVEDFDGTCRYLLSFLGLEWDDNLRNYQKTALERGGINTPSYNQVIQPLYKQANGRWMNYRKQMQPVLPVLNPWIEAFGY